jgi:hypothetical protein
VAVTSAVLCTFIFFGEETNSAFWTLCL